MVQWWFVSPRRTTGRQRLTIILRRPIIGRLAPFIVLTASTVRGAPGRTALRWCASRIRNGSRPVLTGGSTTASETGASPQGSCTAAATRTGSAVLSGQSSFLMVMTIPSSPTPSDDLAGCEAGMSDQNQRDPHFRLASSRSDPGAPVDLMTPHRLTHPEARGQKLTKKKAGRIARSGRLLH